MPLPTPPPIPDSLKWPAPPPAPEGPRVAVPSIAEIITEALADLPSVRAITTEAPK